jgi:hypothetical protein
MSQAERPTAARNHPLPITTWTKDQDLDAGIWVRRAFTITLHETHAVCHGFDVQWDRDESTLQPTRHVIKGEAHRALMTLAHEQFELDAQEGDRDDARNAGAAFLLLQDIGF